MATNRFATPVFTGVWISLGLTLVLGTSGCYDLCNPGHGIHACDNAASSSDDEQGGGDGAVLSLPFPEGTAWRCTQGANGSYSHQGDSTKYGIDLDTPNGEDEEIYAPAGGVARVHEESATANFGYHVNIDVGGGEYVVLGHFSEIFVADGSEVAAGQMLGYDGCTGACSGDHAHVGLMEGDPALMAEYGTSIDASFYAMDTSVGGADFEAIAAGDFVCSTESGHVYESALPVNRWHPDGTLVKVPNSPSVYRVEDGLARHVANEAVFWSYNLDFDDLALISDEELACLGTGEEIASEGSVAAAYDGDETAWLLIEDTDGSRWKQRVPSSGREDVLQSWGTGGDELADAEALDESDLDRYSTRPGYVPFRDGSLLKEESRSDVYVVSDGIALPVKDWDTYLLLGFGARAILTVSDGEIESVMGDDVGSCAAGIWCLDKDAVTACGGGLELGAGSEAGGEEVSEDTGSTEEDTDEPVDTGATDEDADEPVDTEEPVDTGEDPEEETDSVDTTETSLDTGGATETDPSDEFSDYVYVDGDEICFSSDGFRTPYDNADAFALGYGTGLDWTLQPDREYAPDASARGYVCLDTSSWAYDDYELTLVSSIRSDGSAATTYLDTGDWWDNFDFCASGSDAAAEFCVSQGGYDYLVGFSKTTSGLYPNGDGA